MLLSRYSNSRTPYDHELDELREAAPPPRRLWSPRAVTIAPVPPGCGDEPPSDWPAHAVLLPPPPRLPGDDERWGRSEKATTIAPPPSDGAAPSDDDAEERAPDTLRAPPPLHASEVELDSPSPPTPRR